MLWGGHVLVDNPDLYERWRFPKGTRERLSSHHRTVDKQLYPDLEVLNAVGAEARLIVSEPLGDLPGAWNEVPEGSWGVVRPGEDEIQPFLPIATTT